MTKLEQIKEKIAKLLKKSRSAEDIGSLAEAEAFAKKASELLTKYNLALGEIDTGDKDNTVQDNFLDLKDLHGWSKTEGQWLIALYSTISKYNYCKIVKDGNSRTPRIWLLGEPHNVEMVMYIVSNMVSQLRNLRKIAWKEYFGPEKKNRYYRGYMLGAVSGINAKLQEQRKSEEQQYTGMASLIKTTEVAIQQKLDEKFGKLKQTRARRSSSMDGLGRGYQDGKKLKVNKSISGSSNITKALGR